MGKQKSKANARNRPKREFDTTMIGDFLELLCWELRIRVFENQQAFEKKGTITNPELGEQIVHYYRKYHCAGLLPATYLQDDTEGKAGEEAMRQASARLAKLQIEKAQAALDALDVLQEYLEAAFSELQHPDKLSVTVYFLSGIQQLMAEDGDATA
ncbi:MAG TPA: hypothetical protein VM238_21320 [Phycisphaerae bacterium]|nr:hypothetical protein [Phycisphaerae bacterium]HUU93741.1 hypothetical protein [Phycisphaerae bacterium]